MDISSTSGVSSAVYSPYSNQASNAIEASEQNKDRLRQTQSAAESTQNVTPSNQGLPENVGTKINITA